jgi:hypothetical protein
MTTGTNGALRNFLGSVKVKLLSILSLFLLLGCASSTQDLIDQAHLTGDWKAVNKRLDIIEKRESRRNSETCPRDKTKFCNNRFSDQRCSCVSTIEVRRALESLGY